MIGNDASPAAVTGYVPGPNGVPLYVVQHVPGSSPRPCSILLVPPFLEEHHWSYRVLYNLAADLARHGFPTWRFEHSGVGNSHGELESASTWRSEIRHLADHALARGPDGSSLGLVGLRLGSALAWSEMASDPRVSTLVMLDPVLNPSRHIGQLLRFRVFHGRTKPPAAGRVAGPSDEGRSATDWLGYALPPEFIESFRAEEPARRAPHADLSLLTVELVPPQQGARRRIDAWVAEQRARGIRVQAAESHGPAFWTRIGAFRSEGLSEVVVGAFSERHP